MVSIQQPKSCPNCSSSDFDFIKPASGTSYVLTTVDQTTSPASFNATSGLPVQVLGCLNCGVATLHVPSLRKN